MLLYHFIQLHSYNKIKWFCDKNYCDINYYYFKNTKNNLNNYKYY